MNRARFLEEAEAEFLRDVQYYADIQAEGGGRFLLQHSQCPHGDYIDPFG